MEDSRTQLWDIQSSRPRQIQDYVKSSFAAFLDDCASAG